MAGLIPSPKLDTRDGEQLAAAAIGRVSGEATVEYLKRQLEVLHRRIALAESGVLNEPICDELTNANPSSDHTVLIEAQAWLAEQIMRVVNLLPEKVRIEFANLFVEMRDAQAATTTLQFTASGAQAAIIPADTQVKTSDGRIIFTTDSELIVANPSVEATGLVAATRTEAGPTLLAPNTLTQVDPIDNVVSVTNPIQVDSGSYAETVEEALIRAVNYVRRGEGIRSHEDVEDAILNDVLFGNGVVKAFPLYQFSDWGTRRPGYVTVAVMTKAGNAVSDEVLLRIQELLQHKVGHIIFEIIGPEEVFNDFNVVGTYDPEGLTNATATRAAAEQRLRDFYAPNPRNFGRSIRVSDVIQVAALNGLILSSPAADMPLAPYELPNLVNVTLTPIAEA